MNADGFDTPEEAAPGDIPARYARPLATAVSPDHRFAVVLLGTNEEPYLYPYEVLCFQESGRWYEGSSSSGLGVGWSSTAGKSEPNVGVHRLVDKAPDGAVEMVISYRAQEYRTPVSNAGYFIFAAWNVEPEVADVDLPYAVRFVRADGTEAPVPEGSASSTPEAHRRLVELMRSRNAEEAMQPGINIARREQPREETDSSRGGQTQEAAGQGFEP